MFRTAILPIVSILFAVVMVAMVAGQVAMWQFANDCEANGGTIHSPSNILGTTWCRY